MPDGLPAEDHPDQVADPEGSRSAYRTPLAPITNTHVSPLEAATAAGPYGVAPPRLVNPDQADEPEASESCSRLLPVRPPPAARANTRTVPLGFSTAVGRASVGPRAATSASSALTCVCELHGWVLVAAAGHGLGAGPDQESPSWLFPFVSWASTAAACAARNELNWLVPAIV